MTADPLPQDRMPFGEFYARYHPRLLGFAIDRFGSGEAEDIAQEAMARALASYDSLDPGRDPWPWLTVVAKNIARDAARRRRVLAWMALDCDEVRSLAEPDVTFEAALDLEEHRLVRRALGRIPARDRDLLLLRECGGATFEDLAQRTGRTVNSLRQHAFRARRRLVDEFTTLGGRALGVGTAVSVRWARLRARADRLGDLAYALPVAAQVATVAVAGAVTFGGTSGAAAIAPVAAVHAPATAANERRVTVAPAPGGTRAPVAVTVPRRVTGQGAPAPRPPRRKAGGSGATVTGTHHGIPGTAGGGHHDRVDVTVAGNHYSVDASGWSSEERGLVCSASPVVTCDQVS